MTAGFNTAVGTRFLSGPAAAHVVLSPRRFPAHLDGMFNASLWVRLRQARVVQILAVYLGASWVVLQIADILTEALALPAWVMPVAILLLLVGMVIILATAWVQSLPATEAAEEAGEVPDDWEVAPGEAMASLRAGKLPHLTWGRAITGGAVALGLLFGGAGLYVAVTGGPGVMGPERVGASTAAEGIAVVPFEVRGADLEVWREGMVDLLSNNLDGVGGFRTIDPRTVMARWQEQVGDASTQTDLDQALRVAGATGARYALVGSMVGTGDRLRMVTNVYDLDSREEVAGGTAEGAASAVLALADHLAVETLRSLLSATGREGAAVVTPESLTTESLAALRYFLDGERYYRRTQFSRAVQAYEAAVAEDSTFALAMFRLSDTYGWLESIQSESGVDWSERALDHIDHLPTRHQIYLRASDALVRGSAEALPQLREAVRRFPDDPEAWYLLAETYIHVPGGSLASPDDAARALDEAVALDPEFGPYLLHVSDVAIMQGDRAKAEATLERYRELTGDEGMNREQIEIAIPLVLGDSAEYVAALELARAATPRTLSLLLGTFATQTDEYDRLEPLNDILGQKIGRSRDAFIAYSMATRGAVAEAEALAIDGDVTDLDRGTLLGHIAALWGVGADRAELRDLFGDETCGESATCAVFMAQALTLEGNRDALDRLVAEWRAKARTRESAEEGPGPEPARRTADIAEGVGLLARGEVERGRELLQAWVTDNTPSGTIVRHALADLALARGRLNEAEALYTGQLMTYGRSGALYGLAKVAEARGDTVAARRWWEHLVTLTEGADGDRLVRVREAREKAS